MATFFKTIVPIETIASFRRMKKLVQDLSVIAAALRASTKLVIFYFSFCSDTSNFLMFVCNACAIAIS